MRAWNSATDDLTLKDGSVVKEYTIRFVTTEREVYKRIEKFFQSLIDEKDEPQTGRLCDNCEHYGGGEVCDHPSIGEVEMGGKGDTFLWIKETPKWCPLKDEPQTEKEGKR